MKDPLFANKIAGAVLAALLLFFGLPQLAKILYGGGHGGGELHLAYPVEFETAPVAAGAAEEVSLAALLAAADPASGERRAALCRSCHTFEEGGPNSTGPNLYGVVGRAVAGHAGFSYTAALEAYGGEWTFERLDAYIANSQGEVPGTAMVQRFPNAAQRADILAYLNTLSNNPQPLPDAPAPAETEAAQDVEYPAESPTATAGGDPAAGAHEGEDRPAGFIAPAEGEHEEGDAEAEEDPESE